MNNQTIETASVVSDPAPEAGSTSETTQFAGRAPAAEARRTRANRANARQSTGPKTPRGKRFSSANAVRHGLTSQASLIAGAGRAVMERLGEDPREFEALERRLAADWPAACQGETGRLLVGQLAELFWKQRRLARAEQGLAARQLDEFESTRSELSCQMGRAHCSASHAELRGKGLWRQPDSPGKFEDLIAYLSALAEDAEARRATGTWEGMVEMIWGVAPSPLGVIVRDFFERLAEAAKPGGTPADEKSAETALYSLHEELRGARRAYAAYRERYVEISPSASEAQLAPIAPEWTLLIRLRNSVFRQIDRTIQLLKALSAVKPSDSASPAGGGGRAEAVARASRPLSHGHPARVDAGVGSPSRGGRDGRPTSASPTKKNRKTKPISGLESTNTGSERGAQRVARALVPRSGFRLVRPEGAEHQ